MEPEDSSYCSKQLTTCPILYPVNHGQNLRYYFLKNNFNVILPYTPRSYRWDPSFRFPNQNALCISLLLVCDTRFLPLIILHLVNTNNIWSGEKIIKIIIKQMFPSFCHFLPVRSKYLPHHPIPEYIQILFVCKMGTGAPIWGKAAGA